MLDVYKRQEYGVKLIEILQFYGYDSRQVIGAIISSVVPELDHVFEKTVIKYLGITPLFVGPGIKTGIKIKIDHPKQLGADILVGIVGGYNKYGAPLLVIDMGTAIKFFYLNREKELLGGIIAPGISTSFSNLVSKTSKLEDVYKRQAINFKIGHGRLIRENGLAFAFREFIQVIIVGYENNGGGYP